MNIIAYEDHSTIFNILLHCPSQTSLRIFSQLIRIVNDKHLERPSALWFNIGIGCDFLHNILNNMSIVVLIVRRSHFYVVVTGEDAKFNSSGSILRFENSLFFLQLKHMVSVYLSKEGVCSCLFTSTIRPIKNNMLW